MVQDYQIGCLWVDGPLSYLEQLCLKSFVDAGHHTVLYTYGEVTGIPDGIEQRPAADILPRAGFLTHERTGSPALHSDLFRYHMLEQQDRMIWADTDAYCMQPFVTKTGHYYGWESAKHVNGGVLGLPQDSETLGALLEFTSDEFAIPPWFETAEQDRLKAMRDAGTPVHAGEMVWGVWGPHAVTHFLQETGEIKHAFPAHVLYPVPFKERREMLKRGVDLSGFIKDDTASVHLYGRRMRKRLVEAEGGVPKRWSLLGKLINKHGIDVAAAPLPGAPEPKQAAELPPSPGLLTQLADEYGSDKGSAKHRYTELYHMLFSPYRGRKINFLEMGLQIGGPEHEASADRQTTDLPSVRMWLKYFRKAEIIGLDVSDFSWFKAERYQFMRCDMDQRANIDAAAAKMPELDIALDDASHASRHQQDGFVSLFPKVKSGGLYIIEDLRWQPKVYEKKHPGIPKTADLFQGFIDTKRFTHPDPALEAELNALAPQISGAFLHQANFNKHRKDQVLVVHKA